MEEVARVLEKILAADLDLRRDPCRAVGSASAACKVAGDLGDPQLMIRACYALYRATAACSEYVSPDVFGKIWRYAYHLAKGGALAGMLGSYLVALAAAGRLGEVEKALEKWSGVLESDQRAALMTYAALALFDGKYAEKALGFMPADVRTDLPRYAAALHEAVELGQYPGNGLWPVAREPFEEAVLLLAMSFLGLAHCRRGEAWGLKLAKAAMRAAARALRGYGVRIDGYLWAAEESRVGNCMQAAREAVRAYYQFI